ncbi:2-hydroxyacyl-CoA dehydratase [Roseinatronobacter sp. NSM]|uniref:2-hydroxyacyl-CoA dehydratase n=1 Tax=Roseinatronobacter sp. NSM TaxID=3457785 RepID=UPI00403700A1
MTSDDAANMLENAFALRGTVLSTDMIGIFGEGFPEILLRATGAPVTCLHILPQDDTADAGQDVADCIEPFVDHAVQRFLHRFACGCFNDLRAIIFCRDDTAALVAYQYALELRRLGLAPATPKLILWNLVHAPHAHGFNMLQLETLWQHLEIAPPTPDALSLALQDEHARATALSELTQCRLATDAPVRAGTAMTWHVAGRWMGGAQHAALLRAALGAATQPPRQAPRLGLIGAAITQTGVYDMIEAHGAIVCDMQPLVAAWPVDLPATATPDAILKAAASDTDCQRLVPPDAYTDTLIDRLLAAQCDAVICQLHPHDDVFGWDVPHIKQRLGAAGIPLVDLGFVDAVPADHRLAALDAVLAKDLKQRGLV